MPDMEVRQLRKTEPSLYYGYIVVVVAFFIMLLAMGLYNVFGVFFNPLLAEFDWTRAMTSGAFSMSMMLQGVMAMVMGGLVDRFGPRALVTLCGFFLGLGYLLMSQLNALWQFYLFYGLIIGTGMSGFWVPLLSSIARWFDRRRSLMTGIVTSGVAIGGLVVSPVLSRLIATYGWRLSYIIQGSVVMIIIVLGAQLLRRAPSQMGQLSYGENMEKQPGLQSGIETSSLKEAIHTTQFWLVAIMFFCFGFCVFSIIVHLVPHATVLGISAINAANILAAFHGSSILGNFVMGGAGDRIGNRNIFLIGFIMVSAVLFWLVMAREVWMLYIIAIVFGCNLGGLATSESPLVAGLFGLSSHGLLLGVLGIGFTIGAALGPFMMGYIFDLAGSYQLAFLACAAHGVVGIILAALLRPIKIKRSGIKS